MTGPSSGATTGVQTLLEAMRPRLLILLMLALFAASPALAKVLAEGKPSPGGFYWQKVQGSNGKVSYLCRKKGVGQVQKPAACNGAKAAKP